MNYADLIISIFDCGSEDADFLERKKEKPERENCFQPRASKLHKAISFNVAIYQCTNELFFFASDADMGLPKNLVCLCNKYVTSKTAWFPIVFSSVRKRVAIFKRKWQMASSRKGMFASTKNNLRRQVNTTSEYKQWGWKIPTCGSAISMAGIGPLRTKSKRVIHQLSIHPSKLNQKPGAFEGFEFRMINYQ